jgi:hypothetical protein
VEVNMNRQHSAVLIFLALLLWVVLAVVVMFRVEIPENGYGYFSQNGLPAPCGSWPGDCH